MALKVIWTPLALRQLEEEIEYIETHWTEREVSNFAQKLEERIEMISDYPELSKRSVIYHGSRKCFITKHNTLYYIIEGEAVRIVSLWNTRQDPERLKRLGKKE